MSTLAVVEEILRETKMPMSVREIVEHAGTALPTRSKTPDTVVARDLSMDIKKKGDASIFIRTAPGRYTMRDIAATLTGEASDTTDVLASTIREDRAGTRSVQRPPTSPIVEEQRG